MVISAVLCIVLGLVLAIWPGMSMHIVCIAIGSVLILGGLVRLAESFFDRDSSMYAQMNMIVGDHFCGGGDLDRDQAGEGAGDHSHHRGHRDRGARPEQSAAGGIALQRAV